MKPYELVRIKVLSRGREEAIVINKCDIQTIQPAWPDRFSPDETKSRITMNYKSHGYNDSYLTAYTVEELWEMLKGE